MSSSRKVSHLGQQRDDTEAVIAAQGASSRKAAAVQMRPRCSPLRLAERAALQASQGRLLAGTQTPYF